MKVIVEVVKNEGMQTKGDVKVFENVKKIIDNGDHIVYWHCENCETIWSKRMHRIVGVIS